MSTKLTQERLKELLHYDPETGVLLRVKSGSRLDIVGRPAGTTTATGYLTTMVDGVSHYCHRLAWLYVYGVWPAGQIDHRNGVRSDNRIANLRDCTCRENQQNRARPSGAANPFRGVSWHARDRHWRAAVTINGTKKNLGAFPKAEDARRAVQRARFEYYGFQPTAREDVCELR